MPQTWQAAHDELTARRARLNKEIAGYPGPITGCDAQFNHLLERRAGLNAELARLSEMGSGTDTKTLKRFVEACPYLNGPGGEDDK